MEDGINERKTGKKRTSVGKEVGGFDGGDLEGNPENKLKSRLRDRWMKWGMMMVMTMPQQR